MGPYSPRLIARFTSSKGNVASVKWRFTLRHFRPQRKGGRLGFVNRESSLPPFSFGALCHRDSNATFLRAQ